LVLFDGVAGQRVSINLTGVTLSSVAVVVYTLTGTRLHAGTASTLGLFLEPMLLPLSGTYTILIDPNSSATGNITISLYDVPADLTGTITPGVTTPAIVFTAPGQNGQFTFPATAGQRISVWITSSTFASGACNGFQMLQPDGAPLMVSDTSAMSGSLCLNAFADSLVLTQTGLYILVLNPVGANTGQITLVVYEFTDVTGAITPGTAVSSALTTPGQNARLSFSGTAGQKVSVLVTNSTIANCTTGGLSLIGPSATVSGPNLCSNSFLDTQMLASSGTYTVVLNPSGPNLGQATVTLCNIIDTTDTITSGTPVTATLTTPGQTARYTFSATAGQRATIHLNSSTLNPGNVRLRQPNGTQIGGVSTTGTFMDAVGLPTTGTYTVEVDPTGAALGSVTLTLTLFNDLSGTITVGGATVDVTIPIPGQRGLLSLAGTASQPVTIRLTNNTMGTVSIALRKPDGVVMVSSTSNGSTFNVPQQTLPVTGTYSVEVDPSGVNVGSITVSVTSP
jgi:hypothetical protein